MDRFISSGRNRGNEVRVGNKRTDAHLLDIEDLVSSGEGAKTTPTADELQALAEACLADLGDCDSSDDDGEGESPVTDKASPFDDDLAAGQSLDAEDEASAPIDWKAVRNTSPGTLLPLDARMRKARRIYTNSTDHKVVRGEDGAEWLMDTRTNAYLGRIVDAPRGGRYVYDPLTYQTPIYKRADLEKTIFYRELRAADVELPGVCAVNQVDESEEYFLFNFNGYHEGVYKVGGARYERYQVTLMGTDRYGRTVALHAMDYWPKITVRAPTTWRYTNARELEKLAADLVHDLNAALIARATGNGPRSRGMGWRVSRAFNKWKPGVTPPCLGHHVEMDGRDLIGAEFPGDTPRNFIEISLAHSGYVREAINLLMNPDEPIWPDEVASAGGFQRPGAPSSTVVARPAPSPGWFKGTLPMEADAHEFSFAGWTQHGFHLYNTVMGEAAFITSRGLPTGWLRVPTSSVSAVPAADRITLHEGEFSCGVSAIEVAPPDYLVKVGNEVARTMARVKAEREGGDAVMDEGGEGEGEAPSSTASVPLVKDCRVTCFDGEMDPDENSGFPMPHSRVVTKICAVTCRYSSAGEERVPVTFTMNPMATREEMVDELGFDAKNVDRKFASMGVLFQYGLDEELAMIEDFFTYLLCVQPTMISAYNMGFDIVYLYNRLMVLGSGAFQAFTLVPGSEPYFNERAVKGANRFTLSSPGLPAVDMCFEIKMISKLPDYRLDTVGRTFTRQKMGKEDMDPARMHAAFRSRVGNYRLAYYCIVDCYLMLDVEAVRPVLRMAIDNAYALSNTVGQMATRGNSHCYIQFYMYVAANTPSVTQALDGSGRIRKVYLPHSATGVRGDIEGGYVCDSVNRVLIVFMSNTLDFNSLYPSNMNENNICPTKAVSPARIEERGLVEDKDFQRQPRYQALDETKATPEMRSQGGFVEGEDLRRLPNEKATGFLSPKLFGDGVVRAIIRNLNQRRNDEKKLKATAQRAARNAKRSRDALLTAAMNGGATAEEANALPEVVALQSEADRQDALAAMHDITQNVLKLIMNTLYGILAACFGQLPFPAAAAAITAYGRWYVHLLREYLLKRHTIAPRWHIPQLHGVYRPEETRDFENSVTYGDTDSIMYTPIPPQRRYWVHDPVTGRLKLQWAVAPRAEHHAWAVSISGPLATEVNEFFARPTACVYNPQEKRFFGSVLAGGGATNGIIKVKAEKTCLCAYYLTKKRYCWVITETESGACNMSFSFSGVQCTRRETPPSFRHAQAAILWYIINGAWDKAMEVARDLLLRIQRYEIPAYELASSVTISKNPEEYPTMSPAIAALVRESERSGERVQVGVRHRMVFVHGQDSSGKKAHLSKSRIKKREFAEIVPYVNTTRQQPHSVIYGDKAWAMLEPTLYVVFGGNQRETARAACPPGTKWAPKPIKPRKRKEDAKISVLSIKMPVRYDLMNNTMRFEREYFKRRALRWASKTDYTPRELEYGTDVSMGEAGAAQISGVTVTVARTILDSFASKHDRRCAGCKAKMELADVEFHYGPAWRRRVEEYSDRGTSTPMAVHTKPLVYCGRCLASGAYGSAVLAAEEKAVEAERACEVAFGKCRSCVTDTAMSADDIYDTYRSCEQKYCPDYNSRNRQGLQAFYARTTANRFPPRAASLSM